MKKRILSLALVVVMVALVAAGSLAYFTDTASESNVYETGNVDINIVEKRVVDGQVVELTENNMGTLQPGVDEGYNKMVYTVNDGDPAYIRTFVAIESRVPGDGEDDYEGMYVGFNEATSTYAGTNKVRHGVTVTEEYHHVEINGRTFTIWVVDTLNGAKVETGDEVLSVCKVMLTDKYTTKDAQYFNDLEVYTVSEAIQAAGFETYDDAMAKLGTVDKDYAAALFASVIPEANS